MPAHADDRDAARAAFVRAVAAENRSDWRDAIAEYEEAYRLAPHPDVLYNLAGVYERLAERRSAAEHYRRYLDDKPDAADRKKVERKIAELRDRPSRVTVTTEPAGAIVIIDGERRGPAPIELNLGAGTHQLVAEHAGANVRRTVALEYGEPLTIVLPVVVARGTLVVTSNVVGAQVMVDGAEVGTAPWTGALDAGRHVVVVTAAGYTTVERTVDVPAEGTAQITGGLGRPLGWVEPPTARGRMGLFGFDAGSFMAIGYTTSILYGYRTPGRRADGAIGAQFGAAGVGFTVKGRAYLATGKVRPYVGAALGLVSLAQTSHAVGGLMFADLPAGLVEVDVFVEGGVGYGKHEEVGKLYFPVLAGLTAHLPSGK